MDVLLSRLPNKLKDKYRDQIPFPVISLAKDLNLKIYLSYDFKNNEAGLIRKEGKEYVIYINKLDPPTRKRFTVAHEIGHFVLHKKDLDNNHEFIDNIKQPILNRKTDVNLSKEEKKKEVDANDFAAQLLMPEEDFKNIFEQSEKIEDVARTFNVSPSAATIRAKEILGMVII